MEDGEITKVVYITGCLGFIGSYVTRIFLKKGYYVIGVDKITYAANEKLLDEFSKSKNFKFIKSDINDLKFLYECDYVINLAAETHVGNSITSSDDFIHSNINGVHHLLELIRNYRHDGCKAPVFLHFSTDEVYGDIVAGKHTETDLLKPSNPYSATKAAADMLILAWARTYNIRYLIVRPTNNYGIGQYVEKLIPKAIKYLMLNKPIPLHNQGTPVRTWLHAHDTANAVLLLVELGLKNEIFNISGDEEIQNIEVCRAILKSMNFSKHFTGTSTGEPFDFSVERKGQDVRYALDDQKMRYYGWKPQRKFKQEIDKIVSYYKKNFIW